MSPRTPLRLRLRLGRHGQSGSTRLRPGGGRIETASRRHRPPPPEMLPNLSQNPAKIQPKSPRPFQNRPEIDPKGLLNPILDLCLQKALLRTPKKRSKDIQKCAKDDPDAPRPHPNGAQDSPKSTIQAILGPFFPTSNLHGFVIDFL